MQATHVGLAQPPSLVCGAWFRLARYSTHAWLAAGVCTASLLLPFSPSSCHTKGREGPPVGRGLFSPCPLCSFSPSSRPLCWKRDQMVPLCPAPLVPFLPLYSHSLSVSSSLSLSLSLSHSDRKRVRPAAATCCSPRPQSHRARLPSRHDSALSHAALAHRNGSVRAPRDSNGSGETAAEIATVLVRHQPRQQRFCAQINGSVRAPQDESTFTNGGRRRTHAVRGRLSVERVLASERVPASERGSQSGAEAGRNRLGSLRCSPCILSEACGAASLSVTH